MEKKIGILFSLFILSVSLKAHEPMLPKEVVDKIFSKKAEKWSFFNPNYQ